MKRRELLVCLAAAAIAEGCTSHTPGSVQQSHAQESQARYTNQIALPKPSVAGTVSLEEAIERRRSLRSFGPAPLPVGTIGQLLWAGQGVTSPDGKRAAPSAGALYPLELYAVTAAEVMHYLPHGHRAETRAVSDLRPGLKAAAVGQTECRYRPGRHRGGRGSQPPQPQIRRPGRGVRPDRGRPRLPEHPAPGGRPRTCRRARGQP
jgi:hypothetical protein